MKQQLIFTNKPGEALDSLVAKLAPKGVFVLTDRNVASQVMPFLSAMSSEVAKAIIIETPAGDVNKNLDCLEAIRSRLNEEGAARKSILINAAGGRI
ncbi:MAG: hypothetical protein K2I89_07870, partial [Muribaculaceae bacterium]|nr:hypothetical protein [Muribaculaceae bacterium]